MSLAVPSCRLHALVALPALALALAACGSKPLVKAPLPPAPRDASAEIARMMQRENGPFEKHRLALFGGLVTGEYEAQVAGAPECTKAGDDESCSLRIALGSDADGDSSQIFCLFDTAPRGPFGAILENRLEGHDLLEEPKLAVEAVGQGVSASFVANVFRDAEDRRTVGTLKVAQLHGQGYSATCSDIQPGGRKTFDRVVGELFSSLTFAPNPRRPASMAHGYELRHGDRTSGFRYGLVEERSDGKPGWLELQISFHLQTDGKTWTTSGAGLVVTRDEKGSVETYRHAIYGHQGVPLGTLSAKPSEDGKFRLKVEAGPKSDALESTPKAPLSTELWSAGELAKVARGARPAFRYAVLSVADGDPTFKYISITRGEGDVLLEQEDVSERDGDAVEAAIQDELHVDGDGLVTKEVSPTLVSERIHHWGKLPVLAEKKAGAPRGKKGKGRK
jgi:predicted small lipoprotein YifL